MAGYFGIVIGRLFDFGDHGREDRQSFESAKVFFGCCARRNFRSLEVTVDGKGRGSNVQERLIIVLTYG